VQKKTQIYYSRSYRHLEPNSREQLVFLLMCVLPCLILFCTYYSELSFQLAVLVKMEISNFIQESFLGIGYGDFLPVFGGVYFIDIPSKTPSFHEVVINLAATLLLLSMCFFSTKIRKGGTPLSIYFAITLLIHLIACIYFMFAKEFYPYSATQYSELYMKQQVSIWLAFIVLAGLIIGVFGYASLTGKIAAFLGIMVYSFIFGCIRYLVFMLIISTVSIIYMATLFFTLGPLFDFIYLVCFYGIYINSQIKRFDRGEGRLKWHWL